MSDVWGLIPVTSAQQVPYDDKADIWSFFQWWSERSYVWVFRLVFLRFPLGTLFLTICAFEPSGQLIYGQVGDFFLSRQFPQFSQLIYGFVAPFSLNVFLLLFGGFVFKIVIKWILLVFPGDTLPMGGIILPHNKLTFIIRRPRQGTTAAPGCLMYELAMLQPPFMAKTPVALAKCAPPAHFGERSVPPVWLAERP